MNAPLALFDAICETCALARSGTPRRISERVWQLPTVDGTLAVKLYTDGQAARAHKEAAVLAHLQARGDSRFRVQALQRTTTGASLWSGHGAHAMLTRWENGHFRTYDTFAPTEWDALGAELAALHRALEGLPPLDTLHARLTAIDADDVRRTLRGALDRASGKENAALLRAYVDVSLRLLDRHHRGSLDAFPADDPQHPIHNDYNQFNYLFDQTLPPVILDWEASIGAPREYEVVRCLNHLPLESPALAEAFVLAYLRVQPLRVQRIAWAVDAACLQHALKLWVVQGWLDDPARFAAHLDGAVKMASTMVDARDRLIDFFTGCIDTHRSRTPT